MKLQNTRFLIIRRLCGFLITLFLVTGHSTNATSEKSECFSMEINIPESTESIFLTNEHVQIRSDWISPQTRPQSPLPLQWKFQNRTNSKKVLAGQTGQLIVDSFSAEGFKLVREIWISNTKTEIAIRQRITNKSDTNIQLYAMYPLCLTNSEGLVLSQKKNAAKWDVLIQQRLKNGRPRTERPEGGMKLEAEQFCLFHTNDKKDAPVLLIGYLSQTDHLARMLIQFKGNKKITELDYFKTECEFDGITLPPGGERTSQWIIIKICNDPNGLIADFADKVGRYYGIKVPTKSAPSVFCSWYFHGPEYNEEYFLNDLAALKNNHMPFDVFLIDECWSIYDWGDWIGNEKWPSGMKKAADRIRELGYTPGIWSCPFIVDSTSDIARNYPEWLLKDENRKRVTFRMNKMDHWVLDPTYPGVCNFLEELYRRLSHDWGFEYFKFDFMRAVFLDKKQKFYNPSVTRLEAYRIGLEAIRLGTGPDTYISVCGGHYGGSLGIANTQRSGSDVVSIWRSKEIPKFRQNILRTWMSRLWHVDPDAMMVRKREEPFPGSNRELSLGKFTDYEANIIALNQYLGGGLICFSEYFPELTDDRRALYRHVIPSINSSSIPLDIFNLLCPSYMLTHVKPVCSDLQPWVTVSIVNWAEKENTMSVKLCSKVLESIKSDEFLVFEFFTQKVLGIYQAGDIIDLGTIAPHHSRLVRIVPWHGDKPVLAGTDLHFSGGGVEIDEWQLIKNRQIKGQIKTEWNYPVQITAAFPADTDKGYVSHTLKMKPGQKIFWINHPDE